MLLKFTQLGCRLDSPLTTVLIALINAHPSALPPTAFVPKSSSTPLNLTNAQIIVAIYAVGDKTDFTTNSGPALLGCSQAKGNCTNQVMKKATIPLVVIPANSGK